MNARELLEQAEAKAKQDAVINRLVEEAAGLAPKLEWTCNNKHRFGSGTFRDPGTCPVCHSFLIKPVYS